jgi:hypothetical protein
MVLVQLRGAHNRYIVATDRHTTAADRQNAAAHETFDANQTEPGV